MIDVNTIREILYKEKTPFYVFEEKEFVDNYQDLLNTFRKIYSNYNIAYSFKTNYTPYICNSVRKQGGYAEVVSDMEYCLAKKIGFKNSEIIYNGPCKGEKLEEHLLSGGISNVDNVDEAIRIIVLADKNPDIIIRVGMRINSDIGANYVSRFGVELDSDEMHYIVRLFSTKKNICLCGVHCHVSRARGIEAWKRRIENLLYAADKYIKGIPEFIDVGSGMYGVMDEYLEKQFGDNIPSYEEYAQAVAQTMDNHYKNVDKKPLLLSEPGTTVVSKYMSLVTSVVEKKNIQKKSFVTVDSSFYNIGEICLMKKLPHYVLQSDGNLKATNSNDVRDDSVKIMGYTCLEQDCIFDGFDENLVVGDMIVFGNVGGYSIVNKPPFIQPNCAVLSKCIDGEIIKIKREEGMEDVFKTFLF